MIYSLVNTFHTEGVMGEKTLFKLHSNVNSLPKTMCMIRYNGP